MDERNLHWPLPSDPEPVPDFGAPSTNGLAPHINGHVANVQREPVDDDGPPLTLLEEQATYARMSGDDDAPPLELAEQEAAAFKAMAEDEGIAPVRPPEAACVRVLTPVPVEPKVVHVRVSSTPKPLSSVAPVRKPRRRKPKEPPASVDPPLEMQEARAAAEAGISQLIVINNRSLADVSKDAWAAIGRANVPPRLFRYGALAARIENDDDDAPVVKTLNLDRARNELAKVATWIQRRKVGNKIVPEERFPPRDVAADLLATADPPLPVLTRVVEVPIFAPDGTLQTTPGYCAVARTYFAPADGFVAPAIPDHPSPEDIDRARELLTVDLIGDFPFVGDADRAHAIAALLLPFVRDMIAGPTPLHDVEAPSPGTGKTLLVDALVHPAAGRAVAVMSEGRDEDEWRKRVFAKLRSGPSIIIIDNLKRRLESGAMASAITAWPQWEDRVLGASEIMRAPVRCLWLATGNNPALSAEMTRRTIRIRLDSKVDRPWMRTGFRHPDLRGWVKDNRSALVAAALTLGRAWMDAGRPAGTKSLGMFEEWARVLGGIMDVARIPGFLGNLEEFYVEADTETTAWQGFVAAWWQQHRDGETKASDLFALAADSGLPLGEGKEQSQKVRLGILIRNMRDRVFTVGITGGPERLRVEAAGEQKRAKLWRLCEVMESGS